eukprot:m.220119 g.220119  ORF g.220119 m.220119 type:complete len:1059 (+) comp10313_c0_seq1:1841-5017(+)
MAHGHGGDVAVTIPEAHGLSTQEVEELRLRWGFNEIADRSKKWYQVLWEQLYGDHWYPNSIPAMMWVAMIISAAIQDWPDAGVIFGLHMFNSGLSFYETMKAGDAVSALRSALAPSCNVKRDGEWKRIMARELVPGDLVLLKIGDVIPADGLLCDGGTMDIDQSGLTGESLPVKKSPGDKVYSGTVVKRGEQDFVVTETGENAEIGKGVALIQSVESKGQVEIIMNRITLFLLTFAILINVLLIIVEATLTRTLHICSSSIDGDAQYYTGIPLLEDFFRRGCQDTESTAILSNFIVLMVAAIPIATPVVVTATMALGARKMAQQNAVVTRLSAIEELAGMTTLCSDKTGTLTKNILTIDSPCLIDGPDGDDLIFKSALAAKTVDPDAIDKCILNSVKDPARLKSFQQTDFLPFDPIVKRTEATVKGPDGRIFKTSKGAPQVILNLAHNKDAIKDRVDGAVEEFANRGARAIAVAETNAAGQWVFLGLISLFDPPRDDTKIVIEQALALGSSVKMITGDHLLIAKETCRRLGMGDTIMRVDALKAPRERLLDLVENVDGFAEVFPEDKFDIVALFQSKGHITGMTGDGVNDAPALRKANVGFAVEGATPAAQGAASVILLTPGLSVIITAIKRSRKIFQRLQNYLIYRVFMSVFLLIFFFISISWANFNFPPVLIIFMCLILDLATMSLAYDKVFPSAKPNRWQLIRLILVASVIGLVAAAANLIFLALVLNNNSGLAKVQVGASTVCGAGQIGNTPGECTDVSNTICAPLLSNLNNQDLVLGLLNVHPLCALTKVSNGTVINYGAMQYGPALATITLNRFNPQLTVPRTLAPFIAAVNYGYNKVPKEFNMAQHPYTLDDFPYTSAVVNTLLFLTLCLSSQFSVFACRVDGWFFTRRPGYVLLSIISTEMFFTSIVAAFFRDFPYWDTNCGGGLVRLTGLVGNYIGIGWLFGLIVFAVMELGKVATYKLMNVYDSKEIEHARVVHEQEERRRRMTAAFTERRATLERGNTRSGTASKYAAPHHPSSTGLQQRAGTFGKKPAHGVDLQQPLLSGGGDSDL